MAKYLRRSLYLVLGVLMFSLAIVMHEGGHLIPSLLLGQAVSEFSLGFGPLLAQAHYGLDWSIRAIPLGGYCLFEDLDIVSLRAFVILCGGVLVNFAAWAVCERIAERRGDGLVEFNTPDWLAEVPWYFGGFITRFFGFPFVVMWRMSVEIEAGNCFRAFGKFHLLLGIVNLVPLLPLTDGSKLVAIVATAVFGGGNTAAALWMTLGPLMLLVVFFGGVGWLSRSNRRRTANNIADMNRLVLELDSVLGDCGWLVSAHPEDKRWNLTCSNMSLDMRITLSGSWPNLPSAQMVVKLTRSHMVVKLSGVSDATLSA